MNQNTSVDSDLQKAIDDITKSTNGDPLFADPVAAPAMPPANVGPFPIASPAPMPTGMPAPAPQIPSPNLTPEPVHTSNPATINTPAPEMMTPKEPIAPEINVPEPPMPEPIQTPSEPVSIPAPEVAEPETSTNDSEKPSAAPFEREGNLDIKDIKEAALRELAPLLSKLDVPAKQKFDIYKNVIDNYHDSSVIASAYRAASEIEDEHDRGEALLYIIDSIDGMNS